MEIFTNTGFWIGLVLGVVIGVFMGLLAAAAYEDEQGSITKERFDARL